MIQNKDHPCKLKFDLFHKALFAKSVDISETKI